MPTTPINPQAFQQSRNGEDPDFLNEAPNDAPRLIRVGEFLQEVGKPPPMLVDKLLPDMSLVLLSGKPKTGKSLAALDILDAVCTDCPVFGQFAVNRSGPVCYFGMEDGQYEIANRLLARGLKPGDTRPLYVCAERFTLHHKEAVASLKRMVAAIQPVLIVVDTARESLPVRDWNDASEVVEKIRSLREFARENCTVLLVTHNRKAAAEDAGDEIAGSNALTGGVDGWLSAVAQEKTQGGAHRLWLNVNGRGGMRGRYVIELDKGTLRYRAFSETDMDAAKAQAQEAVRMEELRPYAEAVEEAGGKATIKQVAERIAGEPVTAGDSEYRATQRRVNEMVNLELLKDTGEKFKGKGAGKPAPLYSLTERARRLWNYGQSGQTPGSEEEMSIIPASSNPPQDDPFAKDGEGWEEFTV